MIGNECTYLWMGSSTIEVANDATTWGDNGAIIVFDNDVINIYSSVWQEGRIKVHGQFCLNVL